MDLTGRSETRHAVPPGRGAPSDAVLLRRGVGLTPGTAHNELTDDEGVDLQTAPAIKGVRRLISQVQPDELATTYV